jgi:PD-(D/E)XK nuclease superfamily
MPYVTSATERASFKRCRRQWDFGAGTRQDLEPLDRPVRPDLDRAVRDALAVYYFPGMWDWDRSVRLPLVAQELERALTRQRERSGRDAGLAVWQEALEAGRVLVDRYARWAATADRFSPVLVETDFEVNVLDPVRPEAGLVTAAGETIRYAGRIDLMAVDAHDEYWIVRHRVTEAGWTPTGQLVADEEALAACWAWEQFYLGMAITGTVYNELRLPSTDPGRRAGWPWPRLRSRAATRRPAVRQHEPSGGGRSIPQHRRMYAQARAPRRVQPIEQRTEDGFRRTWVRRAPADVAEAGRRLGADAAEMAREDVEVYPTPSVANCPPCPYFEPCRALQADRNAQPILDSRYRKRPAPVAQQGRLGGRAWGLGRGAAPPKFRRGQDG